MISTECVPEEGPRNRRTTGAPQRNGSTGDDSTNLTGRDRPKEKNQLRTTGGQRDRRKAGNVGVRMMWVAQRVTGPVDAASEIQQLEGGQERQRETAKKDEEHARRTRGSRSSHGSW
ncbi:predicted protein [Histoplasma capsulatum var. duboisii H88]|uniref:Predicted protein n=1 Tax=Ajellomyces capsulatus (strain H88) TaxID=544711 RepID=F0UUY3_AJEC8|nr:predicted protein [Histoplasma capsulatum var. duboisii H88]